MSLKSHLETLESQLCGGGMNPSPLVVKVVEWYCERLRSCDFSEHDHAHVVVAMRIKEIINVATYQGRMRCG